MTRTASPTSSTQDSRVEVEFRKIKDNASFPVQITPSVFAILTNEHEFVLPRAVRTAIRTGLTVKIPTGFVGLVVGDSHFWNGGVTTMANVILPTDGEVELVVMMQNIAAGGVKYIKGDLIANLIILPETNIGVNNIEYDPEEAKQRQTKDKRPDGPDF